MSIIDNFGDDDAPIVKENTRGANEELVPYDKEYTLKRINKNALDWKRVFYPEFPLVPLIITNVAPPAKNYGDTVEFHGKEETPEEYEAQIIINVKYTGRDQGGKRKQPIFEGQVLDPKDLEETLQQLCHDKEILIHIHGYSVQPEAILYQNMMAYQPRCPNYFLIPLVWNTPKGYIKCFTPGYKPSRHEIAPESGRDLARLLDMFTSKARDVKVPISIMATSMGTLLLRIIAQNVKYHKKKPFKNVFMVGSDSTRQFFSTAWNPGYNENEDDIEPICCGSCLFRNWDNERKKNPGRDLLKLVNEKVHVLWKENDTALKFRKYSMLNPFGVDPNALGISGDWYDVPGRLHPDFESKVVFPKIITNGDVKNADHNYQFYPETVAYYDSQLG